MSGDPISERAAEILAQSQNHPRVKAWTEAEREASARGQAERELARVPYLPGGFAWSTIETTYRRLAGRPPGLGPDGVPFRRKYPDQPSRPELAAALVTNPSTLKRACEAAGRGTQWPPRGL